MGPMAKWNRKVVEALEVSPEPQPFCQPLGRLVDELFGDPLFGTFGIGSGQSQNDVL